MEWGSGQDWRYAVHIMTGAAILFLPLFAFLPILIQQAMKTDTDAVIGVYGRNEQVKKVFWTLFVALAGLVLA
jgi:hypothetical protein